jgi:hypothetical protein
LVALILNAMLTDEIVSGWIMDVLFGILP